MTRRTRRRVADGSMSPAGFRAAGTGPTTPTDSAWSRRAIPASTSHPPAAPEPDGRGHRASRAFLPAPAELHGDPFGVVVGVDPLVLGLDIELRAALQLERDGRAHVGAPLPRALVADLVLAGDGDRIAVPPVAIDRVVVVVVAQVGVEIVDADTAGQIEADRPAVLGFPEEVERGSDRLRVAIVG